MNQFLLTKPSEVESIILGSRRIHTDKLPIRFHKSEILYAVDKFSCVVVVAETGSGKTTQIPQYLVEAGYAPFPQRILVSLPRRMAAISIAQRVSEEFQTQVGEQVGYRVRFDSQINEATKIEYVTDGTLVQLMMSDPLLQLYSVIMIDDVHERTTNTDLVLALLKKIRRKRPEMKLIISSATVQAEEIAQYFEDSHGEHTFTSKILQIEGRMYPVEIFYLREPCKNYVVQAIEVCQRLHISKRASSGGDILVFLTCAEEVHAFINTMNEVYAIHNKKIQMVLLPLYSNLSLERQLEVFKPTQPGTRKIVVATNIAESSITIDGIVYVIDCCYQKVKFFDYKKNYESMRIVPISKQQSTQRTGRAGRTKPGECFRLSTFNDYEKIPDFLPPEIQRTRINDLLLELISFSIQPTALCDPSAFLSPITINTLAHPITALLALGLLKEDPIKMLVLSDMGETIVDYPLDSMMSVCLYKSFTEDYQCSEEMLKIAAVLSVQGGIFQGDVQPITVLKAKKALGCKEGDHLSLCNILTRYQVQGNRGGWIEQNKLNKNRLANADKIYKQLLKRCQSRLKSSVDDVEAVIRCLLSGYFMQVSQRQPGGLESSYKNIFNQQIMHLHSNSILTVNNPEWVIYHELVEQQGRLIMRECTEIDPHWLIEVAPQYFQDVRKDQVSQKHFQEQIKLDQHEETKKLKEQAKLLQDEKVIFGKSLKKSKIQAQGEGGFIKPNIPIKNKEDRIGSIKKSNLLSFEEEDI